MCLLGSKSLIDHLVRTEFLTAHFHSDWFRLETLDDSLQPTIDMLLNLAIFMWFGAVCPWASFLHNDAIPLYRLIVLGILILLFRRLPVVYAMHKVIPQIEGKRQALFVGFFGPIGGRVASYPHVQVIDADTSISWCRVLSLCQLRVLRTDKGRR
jgi:NhaP-type Na+/H+ or K+/H+ antiporter